MVKTTHFLQSYMTMTQRWYGYVLMSTALLWLTPASCFVGSTRDLAIIAEFGIEENIGHTLSTSPDDRQQPEGLGAASNLLLNILFQEVPVLAPKPLWENITRHKKLFDDFAKMDIPSLKRKYGKYTRFKPDNALTTFAEQARYLSKLYQQAMHHINTTNSLEECKQAMAKDTVFKPNAAPASLHKKHNEKWLELSAYLMCSIVPVNRYTVKALKSPNNENAIFYLFLPHQYTERIEQEVLQNPRKYLLKLPDFSATELGLGLKIDRLSEVGNLFDTANTYEIPQSYPEQLLPALRALFIEKNEIPPQTVQKWAFYIMGHGIFSQEAKDLMKKKHGDLVHLYEELESTETNGKENISKKIRSCNMLMADLRQGNRVIGLPIDAFVNLLKFFDTDIDTELLFYSSCSAGGQQWLDSFTDKGKPLRLSYTIMADTLSEAPSLNGAPVLRLRCLSGHSSYCSLDNLINWKKRSLAIDAIYDFQLFFAMARCPKPHPTLISHMIHCLCPALPKRQIDASQTSHWVGNWFKLNSHIIEQQSNPEKHLARSEVNNITSIRLPKDLAFKVIDSKNSFIALTSPATTTIDAQKIDLVLLANNNYDTLTMNKNTDPTPLPFLVSFIPGKAYHTINHLNAPAFSILEILDQFFCCEKLGTAKLFHLKKITCLDDLTSKQPQKAVFTNCYLYLSVPFGEHKPAHKFNGIVLDYDGKHLAMSWPYLDTTPDRPCFKPLNQTEYQALLDQLLKTFANANQFEQFSQDNNALITLEEIADFYEDE